MNSVADFRRYLGARAAHYTEAQLKKALDAASFERTEPPAVSMEDAKLLDVKTVTQPDDFSCGAAASMSVGRYYGVGPDSLDQWKEDLGTNIHTSTRPPDIVNYFQQLGCQVEARNNLTIDDLRDYWQRGWPVICPFQEWGEPDQQASFFYGHYSTVVGVGLGMIFLSDPSINNVLAGEDSDQAPGLTMITEENWLKNWHDEDVDGNPYIHYGIAVGPPEGGINRISNLVTKAHGKDNLDRLGGELPVIAPEMLKRADFITYPKRVKEGSNCASCRFNQKIEGQHQCTFHDEEKGIDLRGQPVNERNCCGEWDAPGTLRSWQSETVTKAWEEGKHPRGQSGNAGQFASVGHALQQAHPFPGPMPIQPAGMMNPKMRAESPELQHALEEHDRWAGAYNRAWTAHAIHRFLNEEPRRLEPVPPADAPLKKKLARFQRAADDVKTASAEITHLGPAFQRHHDAAIVAHPEGKEALEAARHVARQIYEAALERANQHLDGIPAGTEREKAQRILQRNLHEDDSQPITKSWESSKHPRGGHPENAGQFSHNARTNLAPYPSFPGAPGAKTPTTRPTPADYLEPPKKNPWGKLRDKIEEDRKDPAKRAEMEAEVARQKERNRLNQEHYERVNAMPSSSADLSPLHKSLEQSPIRRADKLRDSGVNESHLLTLNDGTRGVFKPRSGEMEQPRKGVPMKTGYKREVAASRLADVLGFGDLVPPTTFRKQAGHGIGSMQAYVPDADAPLASLSPFDGPEDAARAAVFDYILGHLDRHAKNWLLKDDKLQLIDNGCSLPAKYVQGDFFNMKLWENAGLHKLKVPLSMTELAGKWPDAEKSLRESGIEDEAIALAKQRFDAATSGDYQYIADLPSLIPEDQRDSEDTGDTLGSMARFYNREAREQRYRDALKRRKAKVSGRSDKETHVR